MKRLGGFGAKSVSKTFTRFKSVSDEKLQELKEHKLKKHTYAKMMWGVRTFSDWRKECLKQCYDIKIWQADLDNVQGILIQSMVFCIVKIFG